jgi:hypothetical protein
VSFCLLGIQHASITLHAVVFVAGYISTVMFSTAIPGAPAWAQPPEVFDELIKVAGPEQGRGAQQRGGGG